MTTRIRTQRAAAPRIRTATMRRGIAAAIVGTALAASLLAVPAAATADAPQAPLSTGEAASAPAAHDVTVQLFQWPWKSIATECTRVLGPDGYGAVQVSPPQAAVELPGQRYPWWEAYQPVSYSLQSRYGDQQDFSEMVTACHHAGVRVYVDAVLNHMTGQADGGVGSDGSRFGYYDYPGL